MSKIHLLTQTSGFIEDRAVIISLRYNTESKDFSVYTIHNNDYGSVSTLITSTFSFRLAEEAYKKNVQAIEYENYDVITTWTKYYEYYKYLHEQQVFSPKEFEYEIY